MEKKTKQRIFAAVILSGLVITLLPFLQNKTPTTDVAELKAPPFPDQAVRMSANDTNTLNTPAPNLDPTAINNTDVNQQPDDIISNIHPNVITATPDMIKHPSEANAKPIPSTITKEENSYEVTTPMDDIDVTKDAPKEVLTQAKEKTAVKLAKVDKKTKGVKLATIKPKGSEGLLDLKKPAWVIQLGSFKNKDNALRLVTQLRANGYHAFMQHFSNPYGESTRVYVGPENEKTIANNLANRLSMNMHLQGIVISYKPMTM